MLVMKQQSMIALPRHNMLVTARKLGKFMAAPNEKLAGSLDVLKALQAGGRRRVFRSDDLSRVHRERLVENGFLQEVMKGWLMSASPGARAGDSTPWYASFWEFCALYSAERFGDEWHLSAEESLWLHGEKTVIREQIVVCSPKGSNHLINLLYGTSLYDLKVPEMPAPRNLVMRDGLRLFSPAASLVGVGETFFARNPVESQVVLASLADASDLLRLLLDGGNSTKAGYLAGAFRRIGRTELAEEIVRAMKRAGYDVRESDPFDAGLTLGRPRPGAVPIVGRLEMMWQATRDTVIKNFPKAPGLPKDSGTYLRNVDEIYQSDAYHSLSIEGYSVTPEIIDRVRQGNWNPDNDEADRRSRDALAARGYWQAFQVVKESVSKVLAGGNPGGLARAEHKEWYGELLQPCVTVGLLRASDLAGYRNNAVYLRTSCYAPPRWEAVRDAMPAFFDLLEKETEPSVRAVLGHWLFGYIHPYPDGNGRMARFLMNVMLASGGYPWTVIRMRDRKAYLAALDRASINVDLGPFTTLIAQRVRWVLEKHDLKFPDQAEKWDFDREVVVFFGQDGDGRVRCAISREALDEEFGGDKREKVEVFRKNRAAIEQAARQKYAAGDTETDGSVLIHSGELAKPRAARK
jgi:fido (protein-threonine AMPylation protein)